MFPTLYHFLKDLFGIELPFLQVVNTFGLFVAFAIGAAYWSVSNEFSRRTKLGQFKTNKKEVISGEAFPMSDYLFNGLLLFLFGFKFIYLMKNSGSGFVPQEHVLTWEGEWLWGLIIAVAGTYWRYQTDKKQRLNPPQKKEITLGLADEMGNITAIALISGFLGAKVFHIIETPGNFSFQAIASQFFTSGGWTFYGGLICGLGGVLIYTHKRGYPIIHVLDSAGPPMMLAYGVGRFGCHFSGDGDWGVANPSPNSWLPDWAWAYKYPHNVLGKDYASAGMEKIPGCEGSYCYQLIDPVYPTPLYEALMALTLFAVLWFWVRNLKINPGQALGVYLLFAGTERFIIELIREHGDSLYKVGNLIFSQAQMISTVLIVLGIGLWFAGSKNLLSKEKK